MNSCNPLRAAYCVNASCQFLVMMRECSLSEHHDDSTGLMHFERVCLMNEWSPGELLARVAFMHYDVKGRGTLKHYAVFKGLILNCKYRHFFVNLFLNTCTSR